MCPNGTRRSCAQSWSQSSFHTNAQAPRSRGPRCSSHHNATSVKSPSSGKCRNKGCQTKGHEGSASASESHCLANATRRGSLGKRFQPCFSQILLQIRGTICRSESTSSTFSRSGASSSIDATCSAPGMLTRSHSPGIAQFCSSIFIAERRRGFLSGGQAASQSAKCSKAIACVVGSIILLVSIPATCSARAGLNTNFGV